MKRFTTKGSILLVTATMVLGLLAGCSGSQNEPPAETTSTETTAEITTEAPDQPGLSNELTSWKIGLGVVTNGSGSKDADNSDGVAKSYSIAAALLLDELGVIRDCVIDALQTTVNFDTKGQLTTDMTTVFRTKNQLGKDYGMHKVSSLGLEWNEQAKAFAQFCIGKTVDEVLGLELVDKKAVDTVSSVTIKVNDFIKAIEKASTLSITAQPSENSQLHLMIATDMTRSKAAEEGKDGKVEAYTTYVAAAVNSEQVITGCFIDSSQASVTFDTTSKITNDVNAEVLTKDELGDNYGLRTVSSLGKEWNEQALGFAQYCVGKTVSDVLTIELNGGSAVGADVLSTATVSVDSWLAVLGQLQ